MQCFFCVAAAFGEWQNERELWLLETDQFRSGVPNLGVNYPNWVMGPFDFGNGLIFLY